MKKEIRISLEGRDLRLSNLDKVLYPVAKSTKAMMIDYYSRIAPVLLPHLRGRPLTMKRYPDGVGGEYFYEKECPSHRPDWIKTAPIAGETGGRVVNYCVIDDLPSLVWAANLADLELHTSLSKADRMENPSFLVFDLDPGQGTDIIDCARVALKLRELLRGLELESFPKTSGSKGLQQYVPLNGDSGYDETKTLARAAAITLERHLPDKVVSGMKKEERRGKVFIDWSQNDRRKTTVCVYSLRARERPMVSTPVKWSEIETAVKRNKPAMLEFDSDQVLKRVNRFGDLFAPVLELKQEVRSL